MADPKKKLAALFTHGNRFSNFGPILNKIEVSGFRGINNLELTFDNPITALSGING